LNFRLLPAVFALAIGLATQAQAQSAYYLVGLRHVYMIDAWPDPNRLDRQEIEEDYSGTIANGQHQYDADMASIRDEEAKDGGNIHQVDRDAVQQNLEQDIADAAEKRDAALSRLYIQCDYVRAEHPQFAVEQDGPYRVMAVNLAPTGEFTEVCFYRPYPRYIGPCPYGWVYGHPYAYDAFAVQVRLFHSTWLSIGSPVFGPVYYAGAPVVVMAPVRLNVIVGRAAWVGGRPPVITVEERKSWVTSKELQRKAGIWRESAARAREDAAVSRYSRSHSTGASDGGRTSHYVRPSTRPSRGYSSGPPRSRNDDHSKGDDHSHDHGGDHKGGGG